MAARANYDSVVRWALVLGLVGSAAFAAGCRRDPIVAKTRYVHSGDRYADAGKYAEAAIEYRNAIQQDPLAADVREKLGDVLLKSGNFPGALGEFVRAADLRAD